MPCVHRVDYAIVPNTIPVGNRGGSRVARAIRDYGFELAFGPSLLSLGMAIRIAGTMMY